MHHYYLLYVTEYCMPRNKEINHSTTYIYITHTLIIHHTSISTTACIIDNDNVNVLCIHSLSINSITDPGVEILTELLKRCHNLTRLE